VYTKITTITPLYVIVNNTKYPVMVGQSGALQQSTMIAAKSRLPFHWCDKTKEQLVCLKTVTDSFGRRGSGYPPRSLVDHQLSDHEKDEAILQWSCGFSISELGQITIQNREQDACQGRRP